MADETPVTWSALKDHCEGHKDDCHELLTEKFQNAVNQALDSKLSEKGIVVMSRLHYAVTVGLAIGTGFGGERAVRFVAAVLGVKVGP
jgi:hypothetical protein